MNQPETRVIVRSPDFERTRDKGLGAPDVILSESPLVSVVMTSFNSAAWVERAIISILRQTWTHLELLLVDDASTDQSVTFALAMSSVDRRLRVFTMNGNFGTYTAKNAGLYHARGDVLTFMDSDDYSEPDRIRKQLTLLRTPGLVATTCNYERQDVMGNVVLNRGLRERQALISLMIKRQVIDEIGWFDPIRAGADHEYFERLRAVYGRLAHANVTEMLYCAQSRNDSLSNAPGLLTHVGGAPDELPSNARARYATNAATWHSTVIAQGNTPYLPKQPLNIRPFECPHELTEAR